MLNKVKCLEFEKINFAESLFWLETKHQNEMFINQ